jgi:hypothetical protein
MIGFQGWDPSALWDEIKFDLRHANDFERVATVGDNVWERVMWILIKPFTKAKAGTSTPRNMPPRANG